MNSKERVKAALQLKIPDRVPYGEFAIDYDTVERILGHETYLRAKAKSQIAFWEGRRDEVVQSWKEDFVELYKKLDCVDIVNIGCMASGLVPPRNYKPDPPKRIDENTWIDSRGRVYKFSEITQDITVVEDPAKWTEEISIEDYPEDAVFERPDESIFEVVDYVIEKLGDEKYILGTSGEEVGMVLLGGMDRGLMEYMLHPEVVKAASKYFVKRANFNDEYYIREGTDGVLWGQDFSYKNGPMISPEMYREFVLPVHKERVAHVKSYGLNVLKHACGNNWLILDMFVEAGFDCYQSIQPTAGMDIKEVKEKYGDKICLWGGVAVEHLVSGTREDVINDVRYAIKYAAVNGGFIMGSSHSIAVGCKYDNYMTMLDEFERLRYCY
ncbi:uroporphyrinogen decarboxylase family protein [Caldanaerobius fijiensis]|uniref:uroporphyrinogen decarboxylase family protein n=1 Tax=Caldanaerobius fijiensis TaxID=456330 RepID=UPI0009334D89|nr:uroporphyrinogen decarboxylase family protein [Caldanaerobius fijiensis]